MFFKKLLVIAVVWWVVPFCSFAATLNMSPATGVYTTGSTFSVRVVINTAGKPVNAADGVLSYNPKELSVVSVSRASSVFNLWTTEPTFSNSAGTISFSGGTPTGYTGSGGTVISVTFRALAAGTPRVTMSSGSVLAADGQGTNVLTSMGSAAYTLSAVTQNPEPEVIVEYVPPANTPAAPKITSATHPEVDGWSKSKQAVLSWTLPGDVTAVRTLLDSNPSSIPTKVYDNPIRTITLDDLDDGVSYFHIQFQNEDGWGRVARYRLGVDASSPAGLTAALAPEANLANPKQTVVVTTSDTAGAPITRYKVQINGAEPREYQVTGADKNITLENLTPGYQNIVVEAFDAAGNSATTNLSFTIQSIESPTFTDVPTVINPGIIPVILGQTSPRSQVEVTLTLAGANPQIFTITSDETGQFRFIPEAALMQGVYTLEAVATDEFGARSTASPQVKLLVEPSGFVKVGSWAIDMLSIIVPLIALVLVSVLGMMAAVVRAKRFRGVVNRESEEVVSVVHAEFERLRALLDEKEEDMRMSRKTNKVTASEAGLLTAVRDMIREIEAKISKEADDVTELTD